MSEAKSGSGLKARRSSPDFAPLNPGYLDVLQNSGAQARRENGQTCLLIGPLDIGVDQALAIRGIVTRAARRQKCSELLSKILSSGIVFPTRPRAAFFRAPGPKKTARALAGRSEGGVHGKSSTRRRDGRATPLPGLRRSNVYQQTVAGPGLSERLRTSDLRLPFVRRVDDPAYRQIIAIPDPASVALLISL